MIVRECFAGDNDHTLMWIQADLYGELLLSLFTRPRDRYLAAAKTLRVADELTKRLQTMNGFDHRTLQVAHDHIAAYFRFARSDGGQLMLGEDVDRYQARLRISWRAFFESEVAALTEDDEFTRALCRAAAFGNQDAGYAAEGWLDRFLRDRYEDQGLIVRLALPSTSC